MANSKHKTPKWYLEYQKQYRAEHPDKVFSYRLKSAIHLLEKAGYAVITPDQSEGVKK